MPKKMRRALILVDLQNDFCRGGSLAVPGGDDVIPLANQLQPHFDLVVATKDWHPKDHMSFASNHGCLVGDIVMVDGLEQILWPDHCVQESNGAEFHPNLDTSLIKKIFFKGTDKAIDSYSAFFDNAHRRTTGLADYLLAQKVDELYILGLATDYCVKFTCLDAAHLGFKTYVIVDACRAVNLQPQDEKKALDEMISLGVEIVQIKSIISA